MTKGSFNLRLELFASLAAGAFVLAAAPAIAAPSDELVAAAKKEGQLTVIALPHDWCGYGALIAGFKAKYGIKVNELNPDAGSGDEIEAIKANKGNKGPQAPDVIDVGLSFGPSAKAEGLLQPYKVSTWNAIPDYGQGRGRLLVRRLLRRAVVRGERRHDRQGLPTDWSDLLKPDYKNAVALAGDPRSANQAIQGVYAAGLSQTARAMRARPPQTGLDFFADLNKSGNFVPVIGKAASLAQGTTPIVVRWDYNALADRDTFKGNPKVAGRRAEDGRRRRRLRAGDQRLRAASERRQAVDGVPLFRRRPDRLAEGLLPSDPLQRTWSTRRRSRPTCSPSCRRPPATRRRCSRRSTSRRRQGRHHQALGRRRRRERRSKDAGSRSSPGGNSRGGERAG